MKEPTIVNIPEIGDVRLRKNARARHISITVTVAGEVRVTIPPGGSIDQAKRFVREKADWIARHLRKSCMTRSCGEVRAAMCATVSRDEATLLLCERVATLAGIHGFHYGTVTIRTQKSRWGSCSARNNISLNAKLARLPGRLVDYVILHELVHTRLKHHGVEFWRELERYVDDVAAIRKELRQYRLEFL